MKQKKKEKLQGKKKEVEEQFEKEEKDKKAVEEYEKWLVSFLVVICKYWHDQNNNILCTDFLCIKMIR